MTPEDVKLELSISKDRAARLSSCGSKAGERIAGKLDRILQWEFHKSFDEANYKVGNFRFWFKIIENGWVRVGYEERFTAGGFGGGLTSKHRYDAFKNIKTLQQIDALFGMMSEEYR